ncbi:MAG: hypothetical protein H6742_13395 [Alphaproteobacteria bacterium]|nr:hypothetical protein [Alphaproteobacteria bacterium]
MRALLLLGLLSLSPATRAGGPEVAAAAQPAVPEWPSPNRVWNAADYQAVAARMAAVPLDEWPRAGSPLFDRLCAAENVAMRIDPMLDLSRVLELGGASVEVLKQYIAGVMKGVDMGPEILGLTGFQMRWAVAQWETMDAFLAAQPPEFREDEGTKQALVQTRTGTATMISGGMTQLENHASFEPGAMLGFARIMAEVTPVLLPRLDATTQQETLRRLDALQAGLPDGPLKSAVGDAARDGRAALP